LTVSPILPALLILCFGQFILTWELSNLVFRLLPMSDGQASSMTELLSGGLVSFVTLCLIAPFIEEMLFRGVFLRGFLNNYSPLLAIALSSVVFGLAHYYLNHIIVATAIGFVLGWLYYTTRSLWPSIIAHAIQNGTSLLSVEMAPESMSEPDPVLFPVTSVPAVLFGIAALVYGFRQIRSISNRA
jgi:membrane protease YdiL (CAAX protease family)